MSFDVDYDFTFYRGDGRGRIGERKVITRF